MKKFTAKSVEETHKISAEIAQQLKLPAVLFLSGDLGAGKTEFVRGLAKEFLGSNIEVVSPTYSLMQCYEEKKGSPHPKKIYHLDFYRLKSVDDLESLGFWDLFEEKNALIVVEWGNLFEVSLPKSHQRLNLTIKMNPDFSRTIELK